MIRSAPNLPAQGGVEPTEIQPALGRQTTGAAASQAPSGGRRAQEAGQRAAHQGQPADPSPLADRELQVAEPSGESAASRTGHQLLAPEIASRRAEELIHWLQQQLGDANSVVARRLDEGWTDLTLRDVSELLLDHGRHQEAERVARASLAALPDDAESHAMLARILLQAGQPQQALAAATAALALDPEHHALPQVMVRAHLLLDDPHSASVHLQAAEWHGIDGALLAAMVAHSSRDAAGSAGLIDEAARQASYRQLGQDACLVAEAFAWLGDADKAIEWLDKAARTADQGQVARVALSPFTAPIGHHAQWQAARGLAQDYLASRTSALPSWLLSAGNPLR